MDLGCGQGRNAVPLAALGYEVTGIDASHVGIEQMKKEAQAKNVEITGVVADMYEWHAFSDYDYIVLDNMFHFLKRDREKETVFIKNMLSKSSPNVLVVFCIQDKSKRVAVLDEIINAEETYHTLLTKSFVHVYNFFENAADHYSHMNYRMIVIKKLGG